jgi:hypothetical protein
LSQIAYNESCVERRRPGKARYREIAYELWRLAIDQRRDVSFETRRELTTIAEDLEQLAARVETD